MDYKTSVGFNLQKNWMLKSHLLKVCTSSNKCYLSFFLRTKLFFLIHLILADEELRLYGIQIRLLGMRTSI